MIETLIIVAYSMFALGVARPCARAIYYDSSDRGWEIVGISLFLGLLAGGLSAVWLPIYAIRQACNDNPQVFARIAFGEPEDERKLRVLEQKVGVKRHTKALEQELLEQ